MPRETVSEDSKAREEIQVTQCPECGTEWERVVTHHRDVRHAETPVQR